MFPELSPARRCESAAHLVQQVNRADAAESRVAELEQQVSLAIVPLAALVLSGECTTAKSVLTDELKEAILEAHSAILNGRAALKEKQ